MIKPWLVGAGLARNRGLKSRSRPAISGSHASALPSLIPDFCPHRFDVGIDTELLAQVLLDEWLIAPGALFHATHRPTTLMRINFATSQDQRFWRALDKARAELR